MLGLTVADCVSQLIATVQADAGQQVPVSSVLSFVIVDTENVEYAAEIDVVRIYCASAPTAGGMYFSPDFSCFNYLNCAGQY